MDPAEFRLMVVQKLAAIESDCKHTRATLEKHAKDLDEVKAFQNRTIGIVGVVSVFASAVLTFAFSFLKGLFSGHNQQN